MRVNLHIELRIPHQLVKFIIESQIRITHKPETAKILFPFQ